MTEILAVDPERRQNADLIVDCRTLGYLREGDDVLDMTYGLGRFWSEWRPVGLVANDIDPARGDAHYDLRSTPWADRSFDVCVLDPPYKLNGTSQGTGAAASDADYGVAGVYRPARAVEDLYTAGIVEAARLTRRAVLVKCQDQISSGRFNAQSYAAWHVATAVGLVLVDLLHVFGARAQPNGRRQLHARRNYSTLLVFERGTR
jgi:hypothetical protein